MDLSIVVFDLRDAIEELREERAELLKRIEALEASLSNASPSAVRTIVGLNFALREPTTVHQPDERRDDDEQFSQVPKNTTPILEPLVDRVNQIEASVSDPVNGILHSGILPEGGSR
jgi:predicted nuclease with TOPRIM domain